VYTAQLNNNLKETEGKCVERIRMIQDELQWLTFVNMVMNFWIILVNSENVANVKVTNLHQFSGAEHKYDD
jgi:hypothetical protein